MSEKRVRLEERDGVAEIVLASAPVNELSAALVADLEAAIDAISAACRAVAVTSAVERVFMAGGDVGLMLNEPFERLGAYVRRLQRTFTRLERLPQPVVAGIDGACLGGGLELALACDVRIASESARLGFPEVTLGILPGAGGTQRIVRAIGQGAARDLLLSGRRLGGSEAMATGLVSRVVGAGEATAAARALAAELADNAPEAVEATKRLALAASENSIEVGLDQEWSEWMQVRRSDNAAEGLSAFVEKRRPSFS